MSVPPLEPPARTMGAPHAPQMTAPSRELVRRETGSVKSKGICTPAVRPMQALNLSVVTIV